ncbi:MAG: hypothetical protein KAU95_02665, partial [Candidatus Aenigmarchaeota archaeon]|nr:hypothetical protein [Candidatus Aenigmarchaeota archaeon]
EKGRYCVVVKDEGNFVRISGISKYLMCKDKRCNKKHLHPTNIKIELKGDSQADIEKSLRGGGVITRLGLEKISLNKEKRRKLENEQKVSRKNQKPKTKKKTADKEKKNKVKTEKVSKTKKKVKKETEPVKK